MSTPVTDNQIEEAAISADSSVSTNNTSNNNSNNDEPSSVKDMVSALKRHSDGTNVIKESIKTFSNPDGSDKKDDQWVQDGEQALILIKALVEEAKLDQKVREKKRTKWEFKMSPHLHFNKTLDDLFAIFIVWSRDTNNNNNSSTAKQQLKYNVSKAFRRLESYADWMQDSGGDEIAELTAESVRECLDVWGMRSSIAKNGEFVWWFDFGTLDFEAIKKKHSVTDHMRAFVWYAHAIMYHPNAQEHGLIFCEDVARAGFLQCMTMVPPKLGSKLDRLTIGVLPVKMTALYLLSTPRWMDMFMKFMGMFMSNKMKDRMHPLKDKEWDKLESKLGGKEYVLKDFGRMEGTLEVDPIKELYFS